MKTRERACGYLGKRRQQVTAGFKQRNDLIYLSNCHCSDQLEAARGDSGADGGSGPIAESKMAGEKTRDLRLFGTCFFC